MDLEERDLSLLCCPKCQGELVLTGASGDKSALCCKSCAHGAPVVNGIPRFVSWDNYAESFGLQWNLHARTQLDSYTGFPISAHRLEAATGWVLERQRRGETILEAGSGAGRFTELLVRTGARIVSFDYSRAVEVNQRNNGAAANLLLFQGDIGEIPCPLRAFDTVICLGVLQHTPDPEHSFACLASRVRPGGKLVIDIYARSLPAMIHWRIPLRLITRHMNQRQLYGVIEKCVPPLVPVSAFLRRHLGRAGARLIPISEFAHLGLPPDINREWAILDTFDMLSPKFDKPQSLPTVQRWFESRGFRDVQVFRGENGVVGRGTAPDG